MQYSPIFNYSEDGRVTTCYIYNTKNPSLCFVGRAYCCPNDLPYKSRITGEKIAYGRAAIKSIRYILNVELKSELKVYQEIYDAYKSSKKYNLDSFEAKLIKRKIKALGKEASIIKDMIVEYETSLKDYINSKDAFHKDKKS